MHRKNKIEAPSMQYLFAKLPYHLTLLNFLNTNHPILYSSHRREMSYSVLFSKHLWVYILLAGINLIPQQAGSKVSSFGHLVCRNALMLPNSIY